LHIEKLVVGVPKIIWLVKSRRLRGTGHVGENKNAYRVLEGKPEVKTPLKRHIHRWKDDIKMDQRHGLG
jgi:hypothetical protein